MPTIQSDTEFERLQQLNQIYQDTVMFAAHQWRNQLSVLTLAVDRLRREIQSDLDAQQNAIFMRIQQSTAAIGHIANNYLNLSLAGEPPFVVHASYNDPIRDLVEPIQFNYADQLAVSGQRCRIQTAMPHLQVWGDRNLLLTVYDNLLSNAIKYGEREGEIVFGIEERDTAVVLSVWNSGPGIAESHLETIFEPFTRLHNDKALKGTGLGLYLSRKIAEAHSGHLRANSLPGEWVRFVLELPKLPAETAPTTA